MMNTAASINKTSSAVVSANPGTLYSVVLTAGSDAATVTLYDNASAGSGTIICKLAAAAANTTTTWSPGVRIPVANGIYATITGTSPSVTVAYAP